MSNETHTGSGHETVPELKAEVALLKEEIEILEEIIDLEEHSKAGHPPKKAKKYRLRIDKVKYTVEVHEMTGRQILALADKTPEKYVLSQKKRHGVIEPVGADQVVKFHQDDVERFQTVARDCTEG